MWSLLKQIFKKKNKEEIYLSNENNCQSCIWWSSEESNNKPYVSFKKYCDIHKKYTEENQSCKDYKIEKFEADEFSTSTPELSLDLESIIEEKVGSHNETINTEDERK